MGSVTECVRWSDYSSSVSTSFFQFWQDGLFTDVTVAVPGGAPVSAHRVVLAARSAELRRLLAHASAGQQPGQPLLLLRGVSADQLRLLLQLLYTGSVQADQHQLHDLLELCRELGVQGLNSDSLCSLGDERGVPHMDMESDLGQAPVAAQPSPAAVGSLTAPKLVQTPNTEEQPATAATLRIALDAAEGLTVEASRAESTKAEPAEAEPAEAEPAEAEPTKGSHFGLPAGDSACWLPSDRPRSRDDYSLVSPSAPAVSRSCTPVTDRADSEAEEATERPLLRSASVTSGVVGHEPDGGPHWERKPPDVTGSEAAFRHVFSLLEALDRRQLLQLRAQADQIMHPDFTSWLPDELLVNILSRLSPRDLLVAAGTCRRWQALSEDDGLWRRCLRLTGASLPVTGPGQPASLSRLYCIRHLAWTELPLPAPKRLKGHESVIRCMAVDGDRIVTGSSDKTVGIWSASLGRLECRLRTESEITCVQVEGDTVVTAGRDCTIGVWSVAHGWRRHRLYGHAGIVWSVALRGGRAASGSDDKTVRFWDVEAGRQEALIRGHETVVRAVCFNGQWVVSGDDAGRVQLWNAGRGIVETVWQARSRYVMVLQHAHGVVVSGHGDGSINVWDVATRRLRHELRAHAGWVTDLAVSDQGLLLSGCKDGTAILWRLASGAVLHKLSGVHGHRQRVTAVRLLRGLAVTGSRDGWVKLWNMGTGALVRNLVTPEVSGGPVKHVWVGPDRLVCGVQNNASDRPQVLVMEMAMRTADGALVSGIEDIVVGATGGNGGKNE
ncbi:F-box/WD repeat-containing protein 7-like [Amphibalanus amphitrite]|uniref:F-box/WD repeat-containing protein 7-like n=1 Tax=Amphibalanus amphitrite TaxID=1232801 RepID=UPI001C921790|nr:F-box/WD repeat-containing protein 7-like [Amphibalanus amphitrite]